MDRVLDKGVVIEVGGGEPEASGIESSKRLALLTIDARVDIVIVGEQRTDASGPVRRGRPTRGAPRAGRRRARYAVTRCTYP